MLDGIQGDSSQHAGGGITATVRHPGVRRFVKADRKQECDHFEHVINMLQCHARLDSILTRGKLRLPAPGARLPASGKSRSFWRRTAEARGRKPVSALLLLECPSQFFRRD